MPSEAGEPKVAGVVAGGQLGRMLMGPWQGLIYKEVQEALTSEDNDRRQGALMVAGMLGVAEMQRPSLVERMAEHMMPTMSRPH